MNVEDRNERENPKIKQLPVIESDIGTAGICVDDEGDHVKWFFRL